MRIWRSSVKATHSFVSAADLEFIDVQVRMFLPTAPVWLALDTNDNPRLSWVSQAM